MPSQVYSTTAPIPSQELLDRNVKYATEVHKPKLGKDHWGHIPHHAVITCMDSRINPHEQLGLGVNDTAIMRNVGGDVTEILTTILAAQTFGVRHFVVLKHTDCGGYYLSGNDIINHSKSHAKDPKAIDQADEGRLVNKLKDFGFGSSTIEEIVLKDVDYLKKNPLIYEETEVSGWVFDDETGKIRQVA
ncbi:hypothetical protein D9758_008524 [Tetrapyrgos nigripes]|uniref:Carbonic anhydrase n=1 Tax=Tetrapyrgos nigripes TaxID=182062 RepID=A0A8H5G5Y5_9AGAR|nr:hypothetical protein D9758_008524 [Tetrapyrgos nigripes]